MSESDETQPEQSPEPQAETVLEFQSASGDGVKFASFDPDTGDARRTVMVDFDTWADWLRPDHVTVTIVPGDKLNGEDETKAVAAGDTRVREPAPKPPVDVPPQEPGIDPGYAPGIEAQAASEAGVEPDGSRDEGHPPVPLGGVPSEDAPGASPTATYPSPVIEDTASLTAPAEEPSEPGVSATDAEAGVADFGSAPDLSGAPEGSSAPPEAPDAPEESAAWEADPRPEDERPINEAGEALNKDGSVSKNQPSESPELE